jgi:hypothetical protein
MLPPDLKLLFSPNHGKHVFLTMTTEGSQILAHQSTASLAIEGT